MSRDWDRVWGVHAYALVPWAILVGGVIGYVLQALPPLAAVFTYGLARAFVRAHPGGEGV